MPTKPELPLFITRQYDTARATMKAEARKLRRLEWRRRRAVRSPLNRVLDILCLI